MERRNSFRKPSEIRKGIDAARLDSSVFEREQRLNAKNLVRSPEYQYLKEEATAIIGSLRPPQDGNSLIAYLTASLRRDAFADLFNRLELLASEIPEARARQSAPRQTERQ